MLILWIICALLVLLALWFVLPPLLQTSEEARPDEARAANVLVYQDQFLELEADLKNGIISEEQYQLDKNELERRLLDDTATASKSASSSPSNLPNQRKLAYALGAGIPIAAVAFYFLVGNPKALAPPASSATIPTTASQPAQMSLQAIEANVAKLAKKLEENPNDAPGWSMLARSYMALERYPDAASAYSRATALDGNNSSLWSDYAEALAMANGQKMAGKPIEAANHALQLDPKNERALVFLGSGAYEVGDYQKAIDYWQKLLPLLPPNSEAAKTVSAQIAKARELAASRGSR